MVRKIKLFSSIPGRLQDEIAMGLSSGLVERLKVWYQQQKQDALIFPMYAEEILIVLDQMPEIYDESELEDDDEDRDYDYEDNDEDDLVTD